MAPRVLRRGPQYTLDVKTRVPTGQIQRTKTPDLISSPDTRLSEVFGYLGQGLKVLGYSLKDFFNQNNQRNADTGWGDMLPEVQDTYNLMDTKSVDQLKELNLQALSRYEDHINTLDYNDKVKDKMKSDLSDYSARKMEQLYGTGLAEDRIANARNLDAKILIAVKNEDSGAAFKAIGDASIGEDAWLDPETAKLMSEKVISDVYYETTKNDLAELPYRKAFDIITAQAEDEEGNLSYVNYSDLTGADRTTLIKTITQAGTLEEQRKSIAKFDAESEALNSLYSNEISITDFMKTDYENLNTTDKIGLVNAYESQQRVEVARLDSIASEPIWRDINNKVITNPDTIRANSDPRLTERTRREMISFLESGIRAPDPYKEATAFSRDRLDELMRKAANGDEPFGLMRSALRLTKETDDNDFPLLYGTDYNRFLKDIQNKAALSKLTSVVNGAERDPRFIDKKTELQDPVMFDEFVRTYTELFYNQINEQDPEKQMNIDEFRSMADKLIDTISDEKLQKEFRDVSVSNQTVGTGLLTSFRLPFTHNAMEDAVTALNEGMYDAMKFIEPEAWSLFQRKMIEQYELIKDKPYDKELRLYKDKIPVFLNEKGEEEMIIISGNIPQVVSLNAGLDKYQNLALGYSVGDVNPENETMLSTGWFKITDDSVDKFGTAYGGLIIRPKGKEEFYIMTETLRGVIVRPFHGNPNSQEDIAAAVKDVTNPIIQIEEENNALTDVENAIRNTAPRSYYSYPSLTPVIDPEVPITPAQKAQEALKAGRF
jgi:hypothetical protein